MMLTHFKFAATPPYHRRRGGTQLTQGISRVTRRQCAILPKKGNQKMLERKRVTGLLVGCVVALTTAMPAAGQDAGDPSAIRSRSAEYSPYLNYNYPDRVFFGDSHVHTSYSTDAGMFGNTLSPDAAYRFAKGETVTSSTGVRARLLRPLDWLGGGRPRREHRAGTDDQRVERGSPSK